MASGQEKQTPQSLLTDRWLLGLEKKGLIIQHPHVTHLLEQVSCVIIEDDIRCNPVCVAPSVDSSLLPASIKSRSCHFITHSFRAAVLCLFSIWQIEHCSHQQLLYEGIILPR